MIGAILAGGRASRLGGGDKGARIVGGRPILARVADVLRAGCTSVLLNANGDATRMARFGLLVVPDPLPDHPGPLAGVLAALDWAATHEPTTTKVATAPADTPFLPADLVGRLAAAHRRERATVTCARSNGRRHPVVALWSVALREDLRRVLTETDIRGMGEVLDRYPVAYVDWPCGAIDPFFNVNTPADLELANSLAPEVDRPRQA